MTPNWGFAPWGLVIGAVVGSYVTTAALRWTLEDAPNGARSSCDGCRKPLGWFETVPVASYLVLRGRCAACHGRITPFHPLGEGVGAVAGLSVAVLVPGHQAVLVGVIAACLLAAAVVDARTRMLPDVTSAAIAFCGVALAVMGSRLLIGLLFAAFWTVLLLGVRKANALRRDEPGLGLGDVKLIAALALWLGSATSWMIVGAVGLGLAAWLVRGRGDGKIAFGPMISAAALVVGVVVEAGLWPTPL